MMPAKARQLIKDQPTEDQILNVLQMRQSQLINGHLDQDPLINLIDRSQRPYIYWGSATNSAPIKIWTSTCSHLKKDSSGKLSTRKSATYYSQEIPWPFRNSASNYAPSTRNQVKLQRLQLNCLPLLQGFLTDQNSLYQYGLLCQPET